MSIVAFLVFGLLAGIVANAIDPRPSSGGLFGAMVLGVLGAVVGGFLGNLFLGADISGFNISSFLLAIGGSLILLWIGRMMSNRAA